MKFVAKERKTIDAVRWGGILADLGEWADALGLKWSAAGSYDPNETERTAFVVKTPGESDLEVWVNTLHGWVEVEAGAWLAYGGTDVYPLDDGELHRLYDVKGMNEHVLSVEEIPSTADRPVQVLAEHLRGVAVMASTSTPQDAIGRFARMGLAAAGVPEFGSVEALRPFLDDVDEGGA